MITAEDHQFLEQIVVWPGAKETPGWINLHTHLKNDEITKNNGKPFVVGWPFKTLTSFIERANWITIGGTSFFDVWYCTSQQSESSNNTQGKIKAVRLHKNATWLKAIWIDIDVGNKIDPITGKPETKHYDTAAEAWAAVSAFRKKVGLPSPSAVINSGGGLHVYWISDQPLSPADWHQYAEGLKALLLKEGVKCDTGLTTDDVRILRVPGTLNHKYDPPAPVTLLHLGKSYDFPSTLPFLTQHKVSPATPTSALFDAPDAAYASLNPPDTLGAGIEVHGPQQVDPRPIFKDCGFFREALRTGGVGYDNTLWNLSVLGTVFMENGNAFAHEISRQHATYTQADTQALYDRKVADRADRGVGYPSCATIAGAGCKACASCPLFQKGKSPLNIRPPYSTVITATVTPQSAPAAQLFLPDDYDIDQNGLINLKQIKILKDGGMEERWLPLFHCKIDDAWAQKDPDWLHLHISTDKGNWRWVAIQVTDFCGNGYEKKLMAQGVGIKYNPAHKGHLETFFMAFLDKMHAAAVAQSALGFGWYKPNGPIMGFAYGSRVFRDDGSFMPAGMADRVIQKNFSPIGELQAWYDAWQYIQMQKRPQLELCVAVAFAAPLMDLTGHNGAMVAILGDKGSGKSYATQLGCAVWGHPLKTREGQTSTDKSVAQRLGSTANLPAYWDEISEEPMQLKAFKLCDNGTGGSTGGRLNSDITQQDRETWSTLLCINGNTSFRDFIVKKQRDHGAMLNRILQTWIKRVDAGPGRLANTMVPDKAIHKLQHHYGNIGLEYTKLIAVKHAEIQGMIDANSNLFVTKLHTTMEERMWLAMCTALLTGAQVANMLPQPVGFDINGIFNLLIETVKENRTFRKDADVNPSQSDYGHDFLNQYIKDRTLETIWTESPPIQVSGRPAAAIWHKLNPNAPMPHGVNVRLDKTARQVKFSKTDFERWCAYDPGRICSSIVDSLKENYKMFKVRTTLAGGTPIKGIQEWVYVINANGVLDLEELLNSLGNEMNFELGQSTGITAATAAAMATDATLADKVKVF